jgi:hypothetical protein
VLEKGLKDLGFNRQFQFQGIDLGEMKTIMEAYLK